jgi:hypothetical protein
MELHDLFASEYIIVTWLSIACASKQTLDFFLFSQAQLIVSTASSFWFMAKENRILIVWGVRNFDTVVMGCLVRTKTSLLFVSTLAIAKCVIVARCYGDVQTRS